MKAGRHLDGTKIIFHGFNAGKGSFYNPSSEKNKDNFVIILLLSLSQSTVSTSRELNNQVITGDLFLSERDFLYYYIKFLLKFKTVFFDHFLTYCHILFVLFFCCELLHDLWIYFCKFRLFSTCKLVYTN